MADLQRTYLLDTDHVSVIQRGGEPARILMTHLGRVSPDDYGTSIISFQEQVEGWLSRINHALNRQAEVEYFDRLNGILRFITTFPFGSIPKRRQNVSPN